MPKKLFLKPANGLKVWLPARGRNIFPEGELVAVDSFVERCISEGSLVKADYSKNEQPETYTAEKEKKEDD